MSEPSLADQIKAQIADINAKTDTLIAATRPEDIVLVQAPDENASAAADLKALQAEFGDILPTLKALDDKVTAALARVSVELAKTEPAPASATPAAAPADPALVH